MSNVKGGGGSNIVIFDNIIIMMHKDLQITKKIFTWSGGPKGLVSTVVRSSHCEGEFMVSDRDTKPDRGTDKWTARQTLRLTHIQASWKETN